MIKTRWQDVPTKTARGAAIFMTEITPECAQEWLNKHNSHNRPLSNAWVQKYATDITTGNFGLTHQGIAFDTTGRLMDGQHRLYAVVEAGKSILSYVFVGQDPDCHGLIDSGHTRSIANVIFLQTNERPAALALAISRQMNIGVQYGVKSLTRPTRTQAIEVYNQHRKMIEFVMTQVFPYQLSGVAVGPVLAVVARAAYHEPHEKLIEFGSILKDAMALEPHHRTVVRLRDALQRPVRGEGATAAQDKYRKTQTALRAFLEERELTRIMPSGDELWPLPSESPRRKR